MNPLVSWLARPPLCGGDDGVSACTPTAMSARFILGPELTACDTSFDSRLPRLAGGLATLPTVGQIGSGDAISTRI